MDRSTEKLIRELRKYSTPELCDGAIEYHTMDYHITEHVTDKKIVGRAYTVKPAKGVSGIVPDQSLQWNPVRFLSLPEKDMDKALTGETTEAFVQK